MRQIVIENPLPVNNSDYKGKVPTSADYDEIINEECQIKNLMLFVNANVILQCSVALIVPKII